MAAVLLENEGSSSGKAGPDAQIRLKSFEISAADFDRLLEQYPGIVPEALQALESRRLEGIPALLKRRKTENAGSYLELEEAVELVEWKL